MNNKIIGINDSVTLKDIFYEVRWLKEEIKFRIKTDGILSDYSKILEETIEMIPFGDFYPLTNNSFAIISYDEDFGLEFLVNKISETEMQYTATRSYHNKDLAKLLLDKYGLIGHITDIVASKEPKFGELFIIEVDGNLPLDYKEFCNIGYTLKQKR